MILKWVSGDRIDFDGIILDEIKNSPPAWIRAKPFHWNDSYFAFCTAHKITLAV